MFLLCVSSAASDRRIFKEHLDIGKRYDFFCRDGQHIRGAAIVSQDEKGFYVKTNFIEDLMYISRDNLESIPKLSVSRKEIGIPQGRSTNAELTERGNALTCCWIRSFRLSGGGGYLFNTISRLREFFPMNHVWHGQMEIALQRKRFLVENFLLSANALEFRNEDRYFIGYTAQVGMGFLFWSNRENWLELRSDASIGMAHREMRGYEFAERNNALFFQVNAGLRLLLSHFFLDLMVTATYMHDQSILFAPYGGIARVGFGF